MPFARGCGIRHVMRLARKLTVILVLGDRATLYRKLERCGLRGES